jgi:non-specific protein-tyrosine kinase
MVLAVLIEQFDTRIRTVEALAQMVDWPILATIWRVDSSKKRRGPTKPKEQHANIEAYRILRTNIGFSLIDKPLHTILVTSAESGNGKTTVASNLAIFIAKAGKNTLLIDTDLRRPSLHQQFGLSPEKMGLSNAILAFSAASASNPLPSSSMPVSLSEHSLTSALLLDPFLHTVNIPNLRVMPSGPLPPNPPELLDSKAMERLFTVLATSSGAEVVIFDTPPLLGLSDTSILAPKVDGTVVVVDITSTNKKNLKQLKASLTQAGAHVLGCVVNKQRYSHKDAAYSHYYYYSTEERNSSKNHAKNGHDSAAPIPSSPVVSPSSYEQKMWSN